MDRAYSQLLSYERQLIKNQLYKFKGKTEEQKQQHLHQQLPTLGLQLLIQRQGVHLQHL